MGKGKFLQLKSWNYPRLLILLLLKSRSEDSHNGEMFKKHLARVEHFIKKGRGFVWGLFHIRNVFLHIAEVKCLSS